MENTDKCIFCQIVEGEIPTHHKVYEDSEVLAFLDINPNAHGHTLVIPKDHFENIYTTPDKRLCHMILIAKKLAIALKLATEADGINIIMNNEPGGNQAVMHAHIHVIPRHEGDDYPGLHNHKPYIGDEAKAVAEKIRENLEK